MTTTISAPKPIKITVTSTSHISELSYFTVEIPHSFLKVLLLVALVFCAADVLHSFTHVVVKFLGFDEVDGLNTARLVM